MSTRPAQPESLDKSLERLLARLESKGFGILSDDELERFMQLYRKAAGDLALARGFGARQGQIDRLNALLGRAHRFVYGRPARTGTVQTVLLSMQAIPATLRKTVRYHLLALLVLLAGALYGWMGVGADPDWAFEWMLPSDERGPFASKAELLSGLMQGRDGSLGSGHKAAFASMLWQHNTQVALLCFFLGFLGGLPTLWLLLSNGVSLGVYSRIHHERGLDYEWFAWILPHGVTEIGAIVLLAGGGLWLGHILIAPGEHRRVDALARVRPGLLRIALLAFPMLAIAALLESFLRQSGMSDAGRYVFAAGSLVFWLLVFWLVPAPQRAAESLLAGRTLAERAILLPRFEEIRGL